MNQQIVGMQRDPMAEVQHALLKGAMVTKVADTVEGIAKEWQKVNQATEDAKDDLTYQGANSELKASLTTMDADPRLSMAVQEDGTSTADYAQGQYDDVVKQYRSSIDGITGAKNKLRAQGLVENKIIELNADFRASQSVRATEHLTDQTFVTLNTMMDNGQMDDARTLVSTSVARGSMSVEKADQWNDLLDKGEVKLNAENLALPVFNAYADSMESGDQALKELIQSDADPEEKQMAIDLSEGRRSEWGKARADEVKQQQTTALLAYGDDVEKAKSGLMSVDEINASFNAGKYGDPTEPASARFRNQLISASHTGVVKVEGVLSIADVVASGNPLYDDSKKNLDNLGRFIDENTEGMSAGEKRTFETLTFKQLGSLSTNSSNKLNQAYTSESGLGNAIDDYISFTEDGGSIPRLHIDGKSEAILEQAKVMMSTGVTKTEAVSVAWEGRNVTELQKDERKAYMTTDGDSQLSDDFDALTESDLYEEPGFGDVEDIPEQMKREYHAVWSQAYNQTGNPVTAKSLADRSIATQWRMTNFNSPDPDEYTIQKHGITGDSQAFRRSVTSQFDGENVRIQNPDGSYSKGDMSEANFKVLSVSATGDRKFALEVNGKPVIRMVEVDGEKVPQVGTFTVTQGEVNEYREKAQEGEDINKRLMQIEHEIKGYEYNINSNPYIKTSPPSRQAEKSKLKGALEEREFLKGKLPEVAVKF